MKLTGKLSCAATSEIQFSLITSYLGSIEIIDDLQWGQVMHAVIETDTNLDLSDFKKNLLKYLPKYMIPKKIILK